MYVSIIVPSLHYVKWLDVSISLKVNGNNDSQKIISVYKYEGMGIGAKVAIEAAALVGAYATANEVLGNTG